MKIGIFGGSFNPPHKMHKDIALDLIQKKYVDKIIYVPTGNKYNKKDLVDAKHRYQMLKIMTKDYENLSVSKCELNEELICTYQTLDYFKNKYPNDQIYFICGTDNLKEFKTWNNYEYILDNFKILVIKRNDDNTKEILKNLNNKNIIITDINPNCISSTEIRKNIKKNSSKISKKVLEYMENQNLYRRDD